MDLIVIQNYLGLILTDWENITFGDHSPMLVSLGIAFYTFNTSIMMTFTEMLLHFKFGLTLVESIFAIP